MSTEGLHRVLVAGILLVCSPSGAGVWGGDGLTQADDVRTRAEAAVERIRRADFEGDRHALRRLSADLASMAAPSAALGSLLFYWRGFARWRSAINGFNDGETPAAIEADLNAAIDAFEEARRADSGFTDATAGLVSCLGYLMYMHRHDAARITELVARARPLMEQAERADPDHPRLLWVLGPSRWNAPRGAADGGAPGRQAAVIAGYERALDTLRRQRRPSDPLVPAWGEPELLMNLAWSHLNKSAPDVAAAEKYATEALALVPHWHYVRDILLPQIRRAKPRPR